MWHNELRGWRIKIEFDGQKKINFEIGEIKFQNVYKYIK